MSSWSRLIKALQTGTQRLDQPQYVAERFRQDMNPRNFYDIDREMERNPQREAILGEERRRLEDMHRFMLMRAAKQFPLRLQQQLQPPPVQGAIPGVNGAPVQNPYPSRLPFTGMSGVRG